MFKYVESPYYFELLPKLPKLFCAGGITGCRDWQAEFIAKINHLDLIAFNPRRENFDTSDSRNAYEQIKWEHTHLNKSDIIIFWFCVDQIQPITLFEYGRYGFMKDKKVFVGIDINYPRAFDVITQSKLANPKFEYVSTLDKLAENVINYMKRDEL